MARNKDNDKQQAERDRRQREAEEAYERRMAEARRLAREQAKDNAGPYDDSKHVKD